MPISGIRICEKHLVTPLERLTWTSSIQVAMTAILAWSFSYRLERVVCVCPGGAHPRGPQQPLLRWRMSRNHQGGWANREPLGRRDPPFQPLAELRKSVRGIWSPGQGTNDPEGDPLKCAEAPQEVSVEFFRASPGLWGVTWETQR